MDRETGRLPAMQIFVEAQIVYDRTGRRSYLLAAERKKTFCQCAEMSRASTSASDAVMSGATMPGIVANVF